MAVGCLVFTIWLGDLVNSLQEARETLSLADFSSINSSLLAKALAHTQLGSKPG